MLRLMTDFVADRERLMKPKKPTATGSSRGRSSSMVRGGRVDDRRPVVLDFVQSRIEAFNAERGGGVSVRKDPHGYTLLRLDDGSPIARLRPKGSGDRFEILYWSMMSDRWRPVGPFGGMILAPARRPRVHRQRPDGLLLALRFRGWVPTGRVQPHGSSTSRTAAQRLGRHGHQLPHRHLERDACVAAAALPEQRPRRGRRRSASSRASPSPRRAC